MNKELSKLYPSPLWEISLVYAPSHIPRHTKHKLSNG